MTGPPDQPTRPRQPSLFDLVSCVDAPSQVISARDGQIGDGGVQGWLLLDRRFLSRLRITVDDADPVGLSHDLRGAGGAVFRGIVPGIGAPTNDPTCFVERRREVRHDSMVETITITSTARAPTSCVLAVDAGADLSDLAEVRVGRPRDGLPAEARTDGLQWSAGEAVALLAADPVPDGIDPGAGRLAWRLELGPGASVTITLRATARPGSTPVFRGATRVPWSRPDLACPDRRLPRAVQQGLDDLEGLLLVDPEDEDDLFAAAGSPWFLTLFGRDSLWTARMLMPVGTDLAMGTLRALARRQGSRHDAESEEQPGRFLHEVRAEPLALEGFTLPPTYYGTADATQLFVTCCVEAWRWGADPVEVRALLPAVERALGWLEQQAGDGFVRYVDASGHGLSNQGWKDSVDSIQWADGSLAEAPIALSEVQGYAFQAAMLGADLLDGFERPGGDHWRAWAAALADRFRQRFWVEDADGRFPAVALDAHGAPVDSVASNMGHLLGTGLLDPDEAALVAHRLGSPDLDSGFGLRTLTARSPAYSPLSYHGGTVWPHDTAIAVAGLAAHGRAETAASLFEGLLRAAPAFDSRLPELYGGDGAAEARSPMPYPAACRPQAWAAAAPMAALVALLGIEVDVPRGRLAVRPMLPEELLPLSVSGLRVGGHDLAVTVGRDAEVRVDTDHPAFSGER
ncbi:amylo-alpha-1,6-glucosidase [Nocardioides sp. GXQ0305]|uniref:amylo-alpha-1,6-glucosidase n=1 Tax=Nocardioides sp. GXQ0305 TaxID=3423912 RepID=UPI003D7D0568